MKQLDTHHNSTITRFDITMITRHLNNKQLMLQNLDYGLDLFLIYVLTLSRFPRFLSALDRIGWVHGMRLFL